MHIRLSRNILIPLENLQPETGGGSSKSVSEKRNILSILKKIDKKSLRIINGINQGEYLMK